MNVLNNLTYGLYVLSVNCHKKDNACIINTAVQVAGGPDRITVAVSKANHTEEMLHYTDDFTLSVIHEKADFSLFRHFGFQSGRDTEKFDGFDECMRLKNGTLGVTKGANSLICAHVEQRIDLGSHTLFVATVTETVSLNEIPSASYAYYHANIKPQPQKTEKKGFRCTVCGYEYEGETLPKDFVCPICKHGPADFEEI